MTMIDFEIIRGPSNGQDEGVMVADDAYPSAEDLRIQLEALEGLAIHLGRSFDHSVGDMEDILLYKQWHACARACGIACLDAFSTWYNRQAQRFGWVPCPTAERLAAAREKLEQHNSHVAACAHILNLGRDFFAAQQLTDVSYEEFVAMRVVIVWGGLFAEIVSNSWDNAGARPSSTAYTSAWSPVERSPLPQHVSPAKLVAAHDGLVKAIGQDELLSEFLDDTDNAILGCARSCLMVGDRAGANVHYDALIIRMQQGPRPSYSQAEPLLNFLFAFKSVAVHTGLSGCVDLARATSDGTGKVRL